MDVFKLHQILLIVTFVAVLGLPAPLIAAPLPPSITLQVARTEATVGEETTWHVTVTTTEPLYELTLRSGEPQIWHLPTSVLTVPVVTRTLGLAVPVTALTAGQLTPILEVSYALSETNHSQFITAVAPLNVVPPMEQVETELLPITGVSQVDDTFTTTLWVRNRTPFTLTGIQVQDLGGAVGWQNLPTVTAILPNETRVFPMSGSVSDVAFQPSLGIAYDWQDDLGRAHHHTAHLTGAAYSLRPNFWVDIPRDIFAIFLGVCSSVVTTFFTRLVEGWIRRREEEEDNRQRAYGILNLTVLHVIHAIQRGTQVSLEMLEEVFTDEGLHEVLVKDQLLKDVKILWKRVEEHNTELTKPGGSYRTARLKDAVEQIRDKLSRVYKESPPKSSLQSYNHD